MDIDINNLDPTELTIGLPESVLESRVKRATRIREELEKLGMDSWRQEMQRGSTLVNTPPDYEMELLTENYAATFGVIPSIL